MSGTNDLDWKTYESVTKYIYETLGKEFGVKIVGWGNSFKVEGKSGNKHQIDILTSHSDGIHSYQTAIECKYWNKKINKDIVMKVSGIIADAGIAKGIIVSKSGFTKDAFDFAKHCNIGLVELREVDEKDTDDKKKDVEIATIEIRSNVIRRRPEIISIVIDPVAPLQQSEIPDYWQTLIKFSNGGQKSMDQCALEFKLELQKREKLLQTTTIRYEIPGGILVNTKTNVSTNIKGLIFTGILTEKDLSSTKTFTLVDQIWLIMKSIFDNRTFTISKNGIIMENKKS